jgi:hypothetical protein
MKNLVAFVMILALGLFCAVGCSKTAGGKKETKPATPSAGADVKGADAAKGGEKADAAKPEDKPKADAAKPADKPK